MALIYAGIDEAGYGPMLGPMCVGLAVIRVSNTAPTARVPDLWDLLSAGVCRSLSELRADKQHRIAVADSKKLKLPNQSKTRHPLLHLERSLLALLASSGVAPCDDDHLVSALGAAWPREKWYEGPAETLPLACDAAELSIASNVVAQAMQHANVVLEDVRCDMIAESDFNSTVRETGSKADVTARAVGRHLRTIRERWGGGLNDLRIVCDRLGGRASYLDLLGRELPGIRIKPIAESPELSAYELGSGENPAKILFQTESESAHMPVAVASMAAKLCRELAMLRLNRYFGQVVPELKSTAGYVTDARRWLEDVRDSIDSDTRRRLVRLA